MVLKYIAITLLALGSFWAVQIFHYRTMNNLLVNSVKPKDNTSNRLFADSTGDSQKLSGWSCDLCQASAKSSWSLIGGSIDTIAYIGKLGCWAFTTDWTTCNGIIDEMKPAVAEALKDKIVTQDFLCGVLAGVCPSELEWENYDEFVSKTLAGKPARAEPKPTGKSTYKVLQINDMHVDFNYTTGSSINCGSISLCCNGAAGVAKNATDAAGYWGSPATQCDIPKRTWEAAIDFIKDKVKPDYAIWLGDNTDHEIWNADLKRHFSFTSYMADYIKKSWGNEIPVFPIFGNHEMMPVDIHNFWGVDKGDVLNTTASYWEGMLPEPALTDLRTKGYYSYLLPGRKVRMVNTFVGFDDDLNFYLWKMLYDPGNQIEWLRGVLAAAEKNGESVFILRHIPIGTGALAGTRHLLPLFDRYANVIRAVFSAHTHSDQLSYLRDSKSQFIAPQFVGPSLTTYNTGGHPSFRVYEMDSETHTVLDYEQYRLDTFKYNSNPDRSVKLEWDVAYKFKAEYKLSDTSFSSYEAMDAKRLASDPEWLKTYNSHYYGGIPTPMTADIQKQMECETWVDNDRQTKCLGRVPKAGYQALSDLFFKDYLVRKVPAPKEESLTPEYAATS